LKLASERLASAPVNLPLDSSILLCDCLESADDRDSDDGGKNYPDDG